jgi:hypothetical protein
MAFRLDYYQNELIDKTKEEAMAEYSKFYGISVNPSNIKIHIMPNRETMDQVQ